MSDFAAMEKQIREQAREWLEKGEVKYVIGYEMGGNSNLARPAFISDAKDVDRLVWNPVCVNNLTLFLVNEMRVKPKKGEEPDTRAVGIVVKPCDSKTTVELVKEFIVPRERVKIIGLTCEGVADSKKLGTDAFSELNDELLSGKCTVCTNHNPMISDVVVGDEVKETITDDYSDIKPLEDMSTQERWDYWEKQVSRCVRCYACREACPLCYCEECVFDKCKPFSWNEKSVRPSENLFYHLVRAMHLAGRCIDCGECERSCPMDIPIRQLNRYLEKRAGERFGVKPGMDVDDKPMFGDYDVNDPQEEIW